MVLNNEYMGMVRQWQQLLHGERYAESYTDSLPDFVKLAESFGWKGIRCTSEDQLDAAIQEMIDHPGPVFFDCCVEKLDNCFPMIPKRQSAQRDAFGRRQQGRNCKRYRRRWRGAGLIIRPNFFRTTP